MFEPRIYSVVILLTENSNLLELRGTLRICIHLSYKQTTLVFLYVFEFCCFLLNVSNVLDGHSRIHSDGSFGHKLRFWRCQWIHLMGLSKQFSLCLILPLDKFDNTFEDQVNHLTKAHEDADSRGHHHEESEDLLFSGTRYEAVYSVGTGGQGTFGESGHVIALVDMVEDVEEASIEARFEHQA